MLLSPTLLDTHHNGVTETEKSVNPVLLSRETYSKGIFHKNT